MKINITLTLNRNIIINEVPEAHRAKVAKYGQMLSVILRVFLSSESVNVEKYKNYCLQLYVHLVTSFRNSSGSPWLSIRPTLHKLLAHSWELIALNNGECLERIEESGLEGNNKILRAIRTRHSRKISQSACNTDCLTRMWVGSDPLLQAERTLALTNCRHCKLFGHGTRYCPSKNLQYGPVGEEDTLVLALLINTNDNNES